MLFHTCRPEHPLAKFGWGNVQSLLPPAGTRTAEELHKKLLQFHKENYSSSRMHLTVSDSTRSLDELQAMITPLFSLIPSNEACLPPGRPTQQLLPNGGFDFGHHGMPFGPEGLKQGFHIVSVREVLPLYAKMPTDTIHTFACRCTRVTLLGRFLLCTTRTVVTPLPFTSTICWVTRAKARSFFS